MSVPLRSASPIRTPSVAAAEIGPSTPIVTPQTSPTTPGSAAKIPARPRCRFGEQHTRSSHRPRPGHESPSRFERPSPPIEPAVGSPGTLRR